MRSGATCTNSGHIGRHFGGRGGGISAMVDPRVGIRRERRKRRRKGTLWHWSLCLCGVCVVLVLGAGRSGGMMHDRVVWPDWIGDDRSAPDQSIP